MEARDHFMTDLLSKDTHIYGWLTIFHLIEAHTLFENLGF